MSADFIIRTTEIFDKSVKKKFKKYPTLIKDLQLLKVQLLNNSISGIPQGKDCYKIRMSIASKNKGKSSGARVITYVKIEKKLITMPDVFDKADKESITGKKLEKLIKKQNRHV
jgi:mRNA-degrading endonuclease RelE of RelBE toxin-antitoxin system